MSTFWFLFTIGTLVSASIAFQWAPLPKDGDTIYRCKFNHVTFPWAYTLSPGEEVDSIEWLYDGFSQEIIALLSHSIFSPLPAFSGRVYQAANGGIVLSHITTGDAGNYTVEINLKHVADTFKHTIILHVLDGLPTSDGQLHVHQEPDAVLDNTTQQWSLVLSCGIFIFLPDPSFSVEWLTPSGQVLDSTSYKNGSFHLHLTNPIEDGSYTCRVPQQYVASACLHGNTTRQASLVLDKTEARFTLMEAEVRSLRHDKLQLEQQVTDLQNNLTQNVNTLQNNLAQKDDLNHLAQKVDVLQNNLNHQATTFNNLLHQEMGNLGHTIDQRIGLEVDLLRGNFTEGDRHLSSELNHLQTNVTGINQRLNVLQSYVNILETAHGRDNATLARMIHDAKTPLIGFNAQAMDQQILSSPTHVKFNHVLYNAGQGYDSSAGDFTAPLSGTYFLIFHTQSFTTGFADSDMKVNGNQVCRSYIHVDYDHGSCHAVVHMVKGDTAWVEPIGSDRYFDWYTTSFAGFLFYADP